MARKYHVEGTKSYLIAAIILFVLFAWFAWDGWFPRAGVLEKHPDLENDSFYAFNKTTAVLLLVGAIVCTYIHLVVR